MKSVHGKLCMKDSLSKGWRFKVGVGLCQGAALSSFLFAVVMDGLTDEVRQDPLWMMMFADDTDL